MELLQVFDKNENMLDEYIERINKKSLQDGKYFMIVLIFIQNSENKFLIQKVSKEKGSVYAFPGGHVTYKDNAIKTVIKEAKEEMSIDLDINEIIKVETKVIYNCLASLYYVKKDIDITKLKLQKEEVESITWLSINEINTLIKEEKFRKTNIEPFNRVLLYLEKER